MGPASVDFAPVAARRAPSIGIHDAIAKIIRVGLGLKADDVVSAETAEESADRQALHSQHPAPAKEYDGKSQSGSRSPFRAKNAPWE